MKGKKIVLIYGSILLPIEEGKTAKYYNNGQWKETDRIVKIHEVNSEFVKFETEKLKYCIRFQKAEAGILNLAA
ncbi:MAG: hypothetical protein Q4D16_14455 [Eubacteriales bacterium]|nr:hypothetical protein [Eubacteriales bacterium]